MQIMDLNNEIDHRFINLCKDNINILLYVANSTEFQELISFLQKQNKNIISFLDNGNMYYIGKIGLYPVVVVKGGTIGQMSITSCEPTINKVLKTFNNIKYLVTVGVCGGASSKVKIGDVIIANEVKDYESQKVVDYTVIDRSQGLFTTELGNIIASRVGLMSFDEFDVHYGKIISGNKLVNSKSYASKLQEIHQEALALDMEGYAISRAAFTHKLNDWLFVKSVSDLLHQKNGSEGQARCMRHALQVLNDLFCIPGIFETTKIKVLISGSYIFNDPQTKNVEELAYKLTQKLIDSHYKIISGYGKCVGNAVVAGAYNSRSHLIKYTQSVQDFVEVYPFPRIENRNIVSNLENIKLEIRQAMVKHCSFSIFIYGRKDDDEFVCGMEDEFRLANNTFVIPIGATGYKAKELWDRVHANFLQYYPDDENVKNAFFALNDLTASIDDTVERIVTFINFLKNYFFDFN